MNQNLHLSAIIGLAMLLGAAAGFTLGLFEQGRGVDVYLRDFLYGGLQWSMLGAAAGLALLALVRLVQRLNTQGQ